MPFLLPFIPAMIGAGAGLIGSARAGRRQQGNQTNNLNYLNNITDFGINGIGAPNLELARQGFQQLQGFEGLNPLQNSLRNELGEFDPSGNLLGSLSNLNLPPEIQQALQGFGQQQGAFRDQNNRVIDRQGRTDASGQTFDRALDFGLGKTPNQNRLLQSLLPALQSGGMTPGLEFLQGQAQNLFTPDPRLNSAIQSGLGIIQSGGRTPESGAAAQDFGNIISNRGQTPESQQLFAQGNQLINSGGFTPQLQELQGFLRGEFEAGGLSPEGRRILDTLIPLIESGGEGGALLPFDTAISFARDQAATAASQQGEAQRRRAFSRGGQPGSVVSSGLQNQALAEFADQGLRAEAGAVQQAASNQQLLQLQQLLGATQGAGGIISGAQQLKGQLAGGLGDVARAASANLSTGANLGLGSQQLANQLFGTASSGLSNVLNAETARLGTGGDIFNQAFGSQLGLFGLGSQLGLGVQGQAGQNLTNAQGGLQGLLQGQLGGLGLAGDISQFESGRIDNSLQNLLGANNLDLGMLQQLGIFRGQDISATQNANQLNLSRLNSIRTLLQQGNQNQLAGTRGLFDIGSRGLDLLPPVIGGRTDTLTQPQQQNPFWDELTGSSLDWIGNLSTKLKGKSTISTTADPRIP